MRFMITYRVPVEKGNELAKNGTLGETIQTIMEELQPEAAYFSEGRGVAVPALPYALMQRSAWKGFSQKAGIPEDPSVVILAH